VLDANSNPGSARATAWGDDKDRTLADQKREAVLDMLEGSAFAHNVRTDQWYATVRGALGDSGNPVSSGDQIVLLPHEYNEEANSNPLQLQGTPAAFTARGGPVTLENVTIAGGTHNTSGSTNGWYATEGGSLALPAVPVSGAGTYNWGEGLASTTIDLVNSLQVEVLTPADAAGDMTIVLLATAESVGASAGGNGYKPVSIWEFDSLPFATADVTVRYDQNSSQMQPSYAPDATEGYLVLALWSDDLSGWQLLKRAYGQADSPTHILTATGVTFPASAPAYLAVMQQFAGDVNLDGAVDVVDLLYVVAAFGSGTGDPTFNPACDFNSDEAVDVVDLLMMVGNWGGTGCQLPPPPSSQMMSRTANTLDSQEPPWYQALRDVGLLDVYLDYIAQHPDAAR
jgi:hypothetical protein